MKKLKTIYKALIIFLIISACTDERSLDFLDSITASANISAAYTITQDNTGLVTISPLGEGAIYFDVYFGDATTEPVYVESGKNAQHIYAEGIYTVKIVGYNAKGDKTEATQELVVSFKAPENLVVSIENDIAVSKKVNVTATADFATMYEFYSGESGVTQPVATANIGEAIAYQYATAGTYNVKVIAKGGAIETTEYVVDFEVTAILAPLTAAPAPPTRDAKDVISIFSDKYTNITGVDFNPNWGQQTVYTAFELNGNAMLQYSNLNYQGIDFAGNVQDASSMETLHIDVWTADATSIDIYPISSSSAEFFVKKELVKDQWNRLEIPLTEFTSQGLVISDLKQFKLVGAGSVFIDNFYFYKASANATAFDDGLLTNGDFEDGSTSWIVGVDNNSPVSVVTTAGNTYYSANVAAAGNPYDVNMSQKVEIIQGKTYTLTFDAWSDRNRTIVSGIGLSKDPWSNDTETVSINTTRTTYTLTLSSNDFGAADARVIFDIGAAIGVVNIDNVSLITGTGNIIANSNFEDGSTSWIVGVDDNSPAPVVTVAGNTYYSVNVAAAGNAYDVNLSQKLAIVQGNSYTLTFEAWSDVNRPIIAGIGLSKDPWSNDAETVNITTTKTEYTLTLSAADFGATDARVLFDLGAAIGVVNIDNVSLSSN
ncbi:carbohydrate binding domain-containing protein [uncultured Polaribacter sp.]|uniref:carbohydrate binding domain-containing protein n=1 Tax=uncultured Polaribacter sp. TaxID=174711 RepID=UPI0030DBC84D